MTILQEIIKWYVMMGKVFPEIDCNTLTMMRKFPQDTLNDTLGAFQSVQLTHLLNVTKAKA